MDYFYSGTEICDMKIEIVKLVVTGSANLIVPPDRQEQIQVLLSVVSFWSQAQLDKFETR